MPGSSIPSRPLTPLTRHRAENTQWLLWALRVAAPVVTHVPSGQVGYVIFDFVADPIPGLHRRILSTVTIAR